MPTRPRAISWIHVSDRMDDDTTIQKVTIKSSPPPIIDGVTEEIGIEAAIRLANDNQHTLHQVEKNRGMPIRFSRCLLQVERRSRRRIFRVYGPPTEVKSVAA